MQMLSLGSPAGAGWPKEDGLTQLGQLFSAHVSLTLPWARQCFFMAVSGQVPETARTEAAKPLEVKAQKPHDATSVCCWPKQISRPARLKVADTDSTS